MKKILALILALTMVFALTACGQTEAPAANPGTESAGTAPTTGGKKIVLTPASWQENGFWAKHIEIFAEYVNEHAANVSVNPVTPGSIVPTGEALQSVSDGVVPGNGDRLCVGSRHDRRWLRFLHASGRPEHSGHARAQRSLWCRKGMERPSSVQV